MSTNRRSALRKAKHLSREVPRLLYKYRRRLSNGVLWQIADATRGLRAALAAGEIDDISMQADQVETLIDRYIEFDAKDELWDYAETLVAALLIALFIRTFLFEAFKIPSGSMIPTLMVDDHIFVSKFVYGVRVPFTRLRVLDWRTPQRGEVIVFEYPGPGQENGKDFIKRVVAVAGDRVRLEDNLVVVNGDVSSGTRVLGRRVPCALTPTEECEWREVDPARPLIGAAARDTFEAGCPCTMMLETSNDHEWVTQHAWPGGECQCHTAVDRGPPTINSADWPDLRRTGSFLAGWGPNGAKWMRRLEQGRSDMEIPEGYVFVMGDNRDNSKDGRYWGLVPLENVRGKALFIWWAGEDLGGRVFRLVH